jgi:hypothetical protein
MPVSASFIEGTETRHAGFGKDISTIVDGIQSNANAQGMRVIAVPQGSLPPAGAILVGRMTADQLENRIHSDGWSTVLDPSMDPTNKNNHQPSSAPQAWTSEPSAPEAPKRTALRRPRTALRDVCRPRPFFVITDPQTGQQVRPIEDPKAGPQDRPRVRVQRGGC